jgi:hypothetical protein
LAYLLADSVELIHHREAALPSRNTIDLAEHHSISANYPKPVIPPVTGSAHAQVSDTRCSV